MKKLKHKLMQKHMVINKKGEGIDLHLRAENITCRLSGFYPVVLFKIFQACDICKH